MANSLRAVSMDEARCGPPEPPTEERVFLDVVRRAVDALEEAGLPYLWMGGIASAVHGRPRWTHDADVFVRPEDAIATLDALGRAGFETERTYPDWLFKAIRDDIVVDVIFRGCRGVQVDEEMLERSTVEPFQGIPLRLLPAEDLVVIKAVTHDEHMPRHWHDALAIVARGDLDWDYLLERARRHGPRRVLSLLLYAESIDLIVPRQVTRTLFEAIQCA